MLSVNNVGDCERCHKTAATIEFTYAPHLRGARRWYLCDDCVKYYAPAGMLALSEIYKKAAATGETLCGWTSYPPKEHPEQ